MADFEHPRDRKKDSRPRSPRRERDFGDNPRENNRRFSGYSNRDSNRSSYSGRDSNRGRGNRRDVQMTKVICSSCGEECEVPFKPSSSKPVYCDACFAKKGNKSSKDSSKDFEIINEKLDKIMKALKIE